MKPKHLTTIAFLCLLISVGIFIKAVAQQPSTTGQDASAAQSSYRLSGPYTHNNLTVFLVHGKDLTKKTFLTLQEALAQKKVRVYETKDVNELAIRNLSNQDIYVQAGDIVRGGDQDRMISIDFIVPPRSGRMPIAAFCVEAGRWSKRGNEENASFSSSENMIATKSLKLAAKREKSQDAVWKNVKAAQDKLVVNVDSAAPVVLNTSSMELTVENTKVKEKTADYLQTLSGILQNKPDVIGYVFAINGHVNSADVYASRALFAKLWPKLLKASAVEAVAELNKDVATKPVASETMHTFLVESEKANAAARQVTPRVKVVTREDDKNIFFETQDRAANDGWVHRNYIRKQ
jgi:ARG/rhodanese/phosphatase superfamily protein